VQCDVHQLVAYKNRTDSLAKLVGQQKSDRFWLFGVNDPLNAIEKLQLFSILAEEKKFF
jgi:hypothetical protein